MGYNTMLWKRSRITCHCQNECPQSDVSYGPMILEHKMDYPGRGKLLLKWNLVTITVPDTVPKS